MPIRRARTLSAPGARSAGTLILLTLVGGAIDAPARAATIDDELDRKRSALERAEEVEGVSTSKLQQLSARIDRATGEVAALRTREAAVQDDLRSVELELAAAEEQLVIARERLRRALGELEKQLVSIYKSGEPTILTVVLDSDGYDDMLGRYEYLSALQTQGEGLARRVREIRDQRNATVETISVRRDEIAAKRAELARTRVALEERERELEAARAGERRALKRVRSRIGTLNRDVEHLEKKIQAQLLAAQASTGGVQPVAGPVQGESSSGMIWPVEGTVTSPFGPRWGRIHEGLDIAAPEGAPIVAAKAGRVIMAGPNGGYGNYTCLDHGGGFSTCYAHQLSIGVSVGEDVAQGEVIGEVGNTGASFGAHLHFETRLNGSAQDPMGYL